MSGYVMFCMMMEPSKELKIVFDVSYCTKGEVTVLRVQQESERVTPQ